MFMFRAMEHKANIRSGESERGSRFGFFLSVRYASSSLMRFDNVSAAVRRRMARTRAKNSGPEMLVRRTAHRLGYRFRLHRSDLPGTPDLVFPSRCKVIFVHGCFWHGHDHPACKRGALPKIRLGYWGPKIAANRERDAKAIAQLEASGWGVLVVWECELASFRENLSSKLSAFLGG